MAENIIFLDIDGVLNTKKSWKIPFSLDQDCIKNFTTFINKCKKNPGIVLTSSWKIENRIAEINDYLQNHEVESYAVIDDDPDEYTREYLKKVSLINSETGFTEKDRKKIKWNKTTFE